MPQSLHYRDQAADTVTQPISPVTDQRVQDKMKVEAAEWMQNLAANLSLQQSRDRIGARHEHLQSN